MLVLIMVAAGTDAFATGPPAGTNICNQAFVISFASNDLTLPPVPRGGDRGTFMIGYTNMGSGAATNVVVTDVLDNFLRSVTVSEDNGCNSEGISITVDTETGIATVAFGSIPASAVRMYHYNVAVQ